MGTPRVVRHIGKGRAHELEYSQRLHAAGRDCAGGRRRCRSATRWVRSCATGPIRSCGPAASRGSRSSCSTPPRSSRTGSSNCSTGRRVLTCSPRSGWRPRRTACASNAKHGPLFPDFQTRDVGKPWSKSGAILTTHDPDGKLVYRAGQALIDPGSPLTELARLTQPFLVPTTPDETAGQVDNVVFVEGLVAYRGEWLLYYGEGDAGVGVLHGARQRL